LNHQNNYVERSTIVVTNKISKFFATLFIIFKVSNKIILMIQQIYFQICIQKNFRSLSKIVLSVSYLLLSEKNSYAVANNCGLFVSSLSRIIVDCLSVLSRFSEMRERQVTESQFGSYYFS